MLLLWHKMQWKVRKSHHLSEFLILFSYWESSFHIIFFTIPVKGFLICSLTIFFPGILLMNKLLNIEVLYLFQVTSSFVSKWNICFKMYIHYSVINLTSYSIFYQYKLFSKLSCFIETCLKTRKKVSSCSYWLLLRRADQ